jgi:hypothetical protein
MLTVTESAIEKLREHLQTKTTDPETAIRLVTSSSMNRRFCWFWTKKKREINSLNAREEQNYC